jgi:hypothetical protein
MRVLLSIHFPIVLSPLTYGLCAHRDPRVLPGYGGVKMTLSDSYFPINSSHAMMQNISSPSSDDGPLLQLSIPGLNGLGLVIS